MTHNCLTGPVMKRGLADDIPAIRAADPAMRRRLSE